LDDDDDDDDADDDDIQTNISQTEMELLQEGSLVAHSSQ
jgi:hypothetical protein